MGRGLEFEDFEADTLTRRQLTELRGDLQVGNGAGDLAVPVPNGKHSETAEKVPQFQGPECALEGCDLPVTAGHGARYCSEAHRRRAAHGRERARTASEASPVSAQEARNGHPMGHRPSERPAVLSVGPFEQLAAAAMTLPSGWRAEVGPSSVVVTWQA